MSVYQRFYVKTQVPREVERLIIETLGGDAQLDADESNIFLRPVEVRSHPQDAHAIIPTRTYDGSPVSSGIETGWYWLATSIDYDSAEAVMVAKALFESESVEAVAEDNECGTEDEYARAWLVDSVHYYIQKV